MTDPAWYKDGLRFSCRGCERCCRGAAGNVFVNDEEIEKLAAHFELSNKAFRAEYTRKGRRGQVLLTEKKNKECIFYQRKKGCSIYDLRPQQCRTYPFWGAVLLTAENWEAEGKSCPGIDCGDHHSAEAIEATRIKDGLPSS